MLLEQQILDVHNWIEQRDWNQVRDAILRLPEPEIAELLFQTDMTDRMVIFRLLPHDIATEVFAQLESSQANTLLEEMTAEETRRLMANLSPDDRTSLFEELPGRVTQKLLNLLSPQDVKEATKLLGYPPDSIGRLMTPDYIAVRPEWTIRQALEHVRVKGHDSETADVLYVTDHGWKLLDALDLRRFILASPELLVSDIMDDQFICLRALEDREEAVRTMERYDLPILPVVDSKGILVGIVTFDDVLDVAQEEATEDFHKAAAVNPIRGSYREARFSELYRKRIGWLVALVFANIFSGAAIANYEGVIQSHIALIFFMPMLIGSSGNAGSQTATLMVRALAMGDVRMSDWGRLLLKEIAIALALGLTMALAVFPLGYLRDDLTVAFIVAITMTLVVMFGSLLGTVLPFLLSKFKLDPATASAPLITSLSDISGVVIYFSIATFLLARFG